MPRNNEARKVFVSHRSFDDMATIWERLVVNDDSEKAMTTSKHRLMMMERARPWDRQSFIFPTRPAYQLQPSTPRGKLPRERCRLARGQGELACGEVSGQQGDSARQRLFPSVRESESPACGSRYPSCRVLLPRGAPRLPWAQCACPNEGNMYGGDQRDVLGCGLDRWYFRHLNAARCPPGKTRSLPPIFSVYMNRTL